MERRFLFPLAIGVLVAAGCGGGSGVGPTTEIQPQTANFGALNVGYQAAKPVQPLVGNNAGGAAIIGMDSANYTRLATNPVNDLAQTSIAFSRGGQVWLMSPDGSNLRQLTASFATPIDTHPSWSPSGTGLAFTHYAPGAPPQVYAINIDGSGLAKVTSGGQFCVNPAWSPNGAKIAYDEYDPAYSAQEIFTINVNGTGVLELTADAMDCQYPAWSPDGSRIYFSHKISAGNYQVSYIPAGGGNIVNPGLAPGNAPTRPAVSLDGTTLLESLSGNIAALHLPGFDASNAALAPPSGFSYPDASFSPDGKQFVFEETSVSSGGGIFTALGDGSNAVQHTFGTNDQSPAWQPFPGKRTLIGSGGLMGTNCSGFLVAEQGTAISSLLVFTATTPTTAHITQQTSGNLTNSIFQVKADSLTSMKYVNGMYGNGTTVLPQSGFTTVTGAIVSFDNSTGLVALVAPFSSAKRAASKAGTVAFIGRFSAVFDGKGKNLAPTGCSLLVIDAKSGALSP